MERRWRLVPPGRRTPIFVVSVSGGAPQQVCGDCGEVEQWSPDGDAILYATTDDPSAVGLLNIGSPPSAGWLKHRRYGIYNPRFSPDGRWVAFNAQPDRRSPARIFVVPVAPPSSPARTSGLLLRTMARRQRGRRSATFFYSWSIATGRPVCGRAAGCSDEATVRIAAERAAFPQPRAVVEELVSGRA